MDEPEVVKIIRDLFQSYGFKMKGQPDEGDVVLNGGDLRVDLQGFKNTEQTISDTPLQSMTIQNMTKQDRPVQYATYPQLLWIECKGDNTSLKELLSDFVSLLLILDEYGGQGVLACPGESYEKIIQYKEFLDKLQRNISKGEVKIMNVESKQDMT